MTYTEESLMALAAEYAVMYAAGQQGGWNELQSAIREVLAERAKQVEPVAHLHDNKTAVTEPHPMLSATG